MNISSFSGLEYPGAASQKMNGASGHQTAAAPNTAGVAPAYHQHQQYSGQYSQQPMPLPPPPPGAYGAPSAPPYAQQPYSAYGAMYGQYPYMDPATYHQYYHSQMGYQQYYQQPPLPQQQQQYAQPPPPPQAPATSVPRPPPPPAVAAPAPVAVAPTPVSAPAARALGPAPAAYAAQPSAYGQRPQRPPQLPPAPAYQYGVPSSTGVPLPPPPPQHSQQQPQHQQYAAATSQTYSQQSAGTSSPAVSSNESAESKQVEEQRNKPAEQAAPAPAPASAPTAVPFNFDLPKHKVRLNSGNRKDGWHKYLSEEDRPAVEKILREAVEFDDEFVNFEKEMQKMASATSSFGDNSLNEYNSMWENWKKNLLTRSEQMMKLMEYNLDNHYKKVCQNYPLFITKSADEHNTANNNTSRELPAEKLPPLLPDPVAPVVSSRQQQQQPLLGQGPPLLPTPAPVPHPVQQQQQPPPARSKYSNSNNKTVPLISGNASSPLLSAPPGREKAALAEPFHHDLQTTAKPVYSTDTAKAVVAPSSSIRGTFKIPGVSIHDMGKVETMLAVDETISKSIMSTINDVEFQSAHNDFSFLRHQAKFMHDVIMYQKVRPRRNLGSVYVHPHVVETTSVNVAPQKRSLIQGRPPNSGAPSAAAVPISGGGGEEGGANLSLLDNALNSALKLLKESRVASTAGDDGGGGGILGSAKPAITKPRHPAGIPKSLINANQSNIIPLTSFKETKPIQVAFSSKSKYNNSLTAIDTSSPMGGDALADDVVDPLTGQKAGVSMKLQRLGPATLKSKSAKTFVLAADEEDLEELEAKGRQLLDSIPSGPTRGRERGGRGGRLDRDRDRDRDRARDWERERDRGRGHDHWDRDRERERDRDRERGRDKSSRERESSSRSHSSRRDQPDYDSAHPHHHHHHRPSSSPPPPQPPLPYRSSFKSTYFEHQGNSNGSGGGNGFPPGAAAVPVGALDFSSADIESFLKQERAQLEKNSEQEEQSGPPVQRLSYTDSRFFTVPRKFTEEALTLDDLLEAPARRCRPPRIVLIIRGLPGSGKSTLARAIKEEEEAASPLAKIRLLSLDDYFVVEKACSSEDQLQLVYEYDQAKESDYKCNLFKAFRKTLLSGYGDFVIVDSVNASLTDVRHYYACAVENNFIPYVIEMEAIVRRLLDDCIAGEEIIAHCYKHNRHGRSLAEIRALYDSWELLPPEYLRVDAYSMAVKLSERGAVGPEVPRFRPKVPGGAAVSLAEQDQGQQQQQVLTVHSDYDTGDVPPSSYPPSAEAPPQSPWTVASDNGGGRPPLQQQQQERPPSPLDPRDADAFMRNKRQSPSSGGSGGGQEEYSSYGEYKRSRYGEVAPPLNMMNEPPPPPPSSHEYGYAHPSYGDPSRGGQYAHPHYQNHQPPPPHPSQYMSEQEYQQYLHQQRAHGQPPPPFQDYASSYYDSQPPPPPSSNYY